LSDDQRKIERYPYRKRATEVGRSMPVAVLAAFVSMIVDPAACASIDVDVVVGIGHRLDRS